MKKKLDLRSKYPYSPVPCNGLDRRFCYGLRISPDIDQRLAEKVDPKFKGTGSKGKGGGVGKINALDPLDQPVGGSAFSPSDITGLAWWYEARSLDASLNDLDLVSSWNDLSGNNRNIVQGTSGNRPQYYENGGKPYIQFLDSSKFLNSSPTTYAKNILFGDNTGTVFMVIYHYNNTGNVTFGWNAAGNGVKSHCSFTDNNIYMDWGGTSVGVTRQSWPEPANWHTGGFRIVEYVRTPTTAELVIDGISQGVKAMTGSVPAATATFGMGGVSGTSNFRLAGGLSYLQTLSEGDRMKVRNYLSTYIKP